MTLRDRWVDFWHALPPFRGRLAIARIVGERLLTTRRNTIAFATLPNGFRVKVDLRWRDYDTLYYFRTYEESLTRLMRDALDRDHASLVDVGANAGVFSIQAADLLRRRGGRALAIEPLPRNVAFLTDSIAVNGLQDVITVVPCAAGDREGALELWEMSTGSIANAVPLAWRGAHRDEAPAAEKVSVPMRPLDALVEEHGITNVAFVKIDVEGAELFVLRGARRLLERDRPLVYAEFHRALSAENATTFEDVQSFADSIGYEIRYLTPHGVTAQRPDASSQALEAILVSRDG